MNSEKAIYEQEVEDALRYVDADLIIWGEELYDASIVIFEKNLKRLIGNKSVYDRFENAALVYFNFNSDNYIRHTIVKWDEDHNTAYISVSNFDGCWKYLKHSISVGLKIHKDETQAFGINSPADIVDISNLKTNTRDAFIKNDKIQYKSADVPREAILKQGRKQSILDNPKNRFFYSKNGGYYHVKDCEDVKTISPDNFAGSTDIPDGYSPCFKCRRRIYLRIACDPYVKQIPVIDQMFKQHNISPSKLETLVFDYGLRFHLDNAGDLVVKGNEDTWIIKGFDGDMLTLWHNNYVKTAPRERYITNGFHDQKVKGRNPNKLFDYIHMYTFDLHLEAEERASKAESGFTDAIIESTTVASAPTESINGNERAEIENEKNENQKLSLWKRILNRLKSLI